MDITIGAGKVHHGSLLEIKGSRYKLQITRTEDTNAVIELNHLDSGNSTVVGQRVDGELEFAGLLFWAKILDSEGHHGGNG